MCPSDCPTGIAGMSVFGSRPVTTLMLDTCLAKGWRVSADGPSLALGGRRVEIGQSVGEIVGDARRDGVGGAPVAVGPRKSVAPEKHAVTNGQRRTRSEGGPIVVQHLLEDRQTQQKVEPPRIPFRTARREIIAPPVRGSGNLRFPRARARVA